MLPLGEQSSCGSRFAADGLAIEEVTTEPQEVGGLRPQLSSYGGPLTHCWRRSPRRSSGSRRACARAAAANRSGGTSRSSRKLRHARAAADPEAEQVVGFLAGRALVTVR